MRIEALNIDRDALLAQTLPANSRMRSGGSVRSASATSETLVPALARQGGVRNIVPTRLPQGARDELRVLGGRPTP